MVGVSSPGMVLVLGSPLVLGPLEGGVHGVVTSGWAPFYVHCGLEPGPTVRTVRLGCDTPTRVVRSQLRTNDYGVLRSTGCHDSQKGRPSSPALQRVSWTWVPFLVVAPSLVDLTEGRSHS